MEQIHFVLVNDTDIKMGLTDMVMVITTGCKSLLESWDAALLPNCQPPLIFV